MYKLPIGGTALFLWGGLLSASLGAPAFQETPAVLPAQPELAHWSLSAPAWQADHEHTLPELVDLALRANPDTRIAWEGARNAALAVDVAQSSYRPRLSAMVAGGYRSSDSHQDAAGFSLNGSNSASGMVSALSLQWLLYDFGQRNAIVTSAESLASAARMTVTGVHQKIIHEVCLAYYAQQAAMGRQATAQSALHHAQAVQDAADARHQGGIGTVLEVTQARQASAQAQLALVRAQGLARDAQAALLVAMGLPPTGGPRIAALVPQAVTPEVLPDVDALIANALSQRPDVRAAYEALQASRSAAAAADADYRPKLFMSVTGAYGSDQFGLSALPGIGQQLPTFNIQGSRWSSTVLLGISIPLYDGQVRDNTLQQARNQVDKATATLGKLQLDAARQVMMARNALLTALATQDAAETLQTTSQTLYDAALDAYRHGVGNVTAAISAQTQLEQAEQARDDARYAALSAAATIAFATGTLGGVRRP